MNTTNKILGKINVLVELKPSLKSFTAPDEKGQTFKKYLFQYLSDFFHDLNIPAEVMLTIKPGNYNDSFSTNSYQVIINDSKCRLPFPTTVPADVSAKELAKSIAKDICQNRELCITAQLSEKIQAQWGSKNGLYLTFSGERFHEFLLTFIRSGLRIDRGFVLAHAEEEQEQRYPFEEKIHSLDAISIKVFLSKRQYLRIHSSGEHATAQSDYREKALNEMLDYMQEGLFFELGIILPKVSIDIDEGLEENDFRIQLNDFRLPLIAGLELDQFLVNDTIERVEKLTWNPLQFMVLNLAVELRRNSCIFLTTDLVEYSTNLLREAFPALVDTALLHFNIVTLTKILRNLLEEELSIRDLRGILESLLAINGIISVDQSKHVVFAPHTAGLCPVTEGKKLEELDIADYSNCLRMSLKRYISHKYTGGSNTLSAYIIDPQIEARIENIDTQPMNDEEHEKLIRAIYSAIGNSTMAANPIILTTVEIRKKLRNLIEKEFPRIAVLCNQELLHNTNIHPIARISWN